MERIGLSESETKQCFRLATSANAYWKAKDIRSKNVKTFHGYSSCTQRSNGDHDREGLPKDAIRKLLPSHKTRLENKNKGMDGVSNEELNLMGLRHTNIRNAEQLYIAMQREALGIEDKLIGK